jgi:hypothetical protein
VRHYCGEPTDVQTHYIQRRPSFTAGGRYYSYGDGYVEIPVEIWTYNFGPYKLMRQIRFVDGVVDEIESLGYGYHETPSFLRRNPQRAPRNIQIAADEQHGADREARDEIQSTRTAARRPAARRIYRRAESPRPNTRRCTSSSGSRCP